jgi:peptidoglycan/LPS O-acetylase OafA/YrhL
MLLMGSLFQIGTQQSYEPAAPESPSNRSLWQERPIAIAVAGCLWLLLATGCFVPAILFVAIEAGPLWLLSVIVIPAIPLMLFALVVSKPTPNRMRLSLIAGVLLAMLGAFLAVPQSADSSPSGGQALLLIGFGIMLASAVAVDRR